MMLLPRAYDSCLRRVLAGVLPNPAGSDQAEPGLNQLSLGGRSMMRSALVGAADDCRSAPGRVGRVRPAASGRCCDVGPLS